jgi:hypothetical protein
VGADGTIRSVHDGRCLDEDIAGGTRNGTKVQLWDCNGWDNPTSNGTADAAQGSPATYSSRAQKRSAGVVTATSPG